MYDVIVVGGGPSGGHAAGLCAAAGMRTLVLERERLPRDKPCGGAVSESTLSRLGPGAKRLVRSSTEGARMFLDLEPVATLRRRDVFFDRPSLDSHILDLAAARGAEVVDRVAVRSIWSCPDFVTVSSSDGLWRGRMVIGADGVNSVVREQIGLNTSRRRPDRLVSSVLECPFPPDRMADLLEAPGGRVLFHTHFFTGLVGLGWVFPKGDSLNVGIGAMVGSAHPLREVYPRLLGALGLDHALSTGARWHLIPCRPVPRVYTNRALLVGDAAGLANPLTGAGIETGLESAEHAAAVAVKAWRCGDYSEAMMRRYQSRCAPLMRGLNARYRLLAMMRYFVDRGWDTHWSDRFVLRNFAHLAAT